MAMRDAVGENVSKLLAPLVYVGSYVRHGRLFHPEGACYLAKVEAPRTGNPRFAMAGENLEGSALVRFSTATWRGQKEWPDVLGCAIRFGWQADAPAASEGDDIQDVLLATFKRSWSLPFSPLSTKVHDFLANHYYSVTPFSVPFIGKVELRVCPEQAAGNGSQPRRAKLESMIKAGEAILYLEGRRTGLLHDWHVIARITLKKRVDLDQERLHFSPYNQGKRIKPVGLLNGLRRQTYRASHAGRDQTAKH